VDRSLAPAFARITYTGLSGIHHKIIPVNISGSPTPGTSPELILKSSTPMDSVDALTAFVDAWAEMLHSSTTIGLCEIYTVDADTGEGTFIFGFDLAAAGAASFPAVELSMAILTMKLINGRLYRDTTMEGFTPVNTKLYPPFLAGTGVAIYSAYLSSADSIVYGRGNSYPFAAISLTAKTSDALRNREGLS